MVKKKVVRRKPKKIKSNVKIQLKKYHLQQIKVQ